MSYSQHDEESVLLEMLPATGRFIDIGAFHPKTLSNTRALYERGWGGVVVEPSPGPARSLVEAYGSDDRVQVVCAAVGYGGIVEMHATDGPVSTNYAEIHEKFKGDAEHGRYFGKFWTPQITLEQLINNFGPFNFVNIDTEGSSVDLLKKLLATPMEPSVICVEHDDKAWEIAEMLPKSGYKIHWRNGTNLILTK